MTHADPMKVRPDPAEVLARLGHTAAARDLVGVSGRRRVQAALDDGNIVRVARGHYALPTLPDPRLTAARLQGVVSHTSAARILGLDVLTRDRTPHVVVPRHRKGRPTSAAVHWIDLADHEIIEAVTSPLRTVIDCARTLPFDEALAIADSALRNRLVRPAELSWAVESLRGRGRRRAQVVARAADGRAASGLESALRATMLQGRIRCFTPQLLIADDDFRARVDLGDPVHRVVLEADSFEHHGRRVDLVRDCHRYDELVVRGWLVLRFAWEHVMFEPEWVLKTVRAALLLRSPVRRSTGKTAGRDALTA
jgi:very-short-patch-repair endonuclease